MQHDANFYSIEFIHKVHENQSKLKELKIAKINLKCRDFLEEKTFQILILLAIHRWHFFYHTKQLGSLVIGNSFPIQTKT